MKKLVLVNGEILEWGQESISVADRGHQFGDGVFEVVPVYNGRAFAILPHMDNLLEDAIKVKIPAIYTVEELVEFHEALIAESGVSDCEIYTQITRGAGDYILSFPELSVPQLTMYIIPVDREALEEKRAKGVNIITEVDERWAKCDVNTLNRLPEVLARQKARESRAFDNLFIRDGKVTESTESTFMVVKDEMLWTHPENKFIHKNITRRLIKERLAADLDMQVIEKAFDMEFVLKADEAFLCGPRVGIMPVTKIDRTHVGDGHVGAVVPKLIAAYNAFVERECPKKS